MSMCYKDEEQEEQLILPSNCSTDTKTKTPGFCSNTKTSSISLCVNKFALLCTRRRRMKKKKEEKEVGGVLLPFFWPEPLIFLRAQRELDRIPPRLPRVLLVCAYNLHTFLAGWRGLTLIKASPHKFPPSVLLVLAAMSLYLWWWLLMVACCCPKATRQGGKDGVVVGGEEKEMRCIGRKGNSFWAMKTKEKAKGEEEKTAVEGEDKWVLCVRWSSVPLSLLLSPALYPCFSLSSWLLNQAPFCVKQFPLMTDLWWGQGSKLRQGSAVTQHAMDLCKNSPPKFLSSSTRRWLSKFQGDELLNL